MNQTMNERVIIFDEPILQFAGGHYASDPHSMALRSSVPMDKGWLITAPLRPILWLVPLLG